MPPEVADASADKAVQGSVDTKSTDPSTADKAEAKDDAKVKDNAKGKPEAEKTMTIAEHERETRRLRDKWNEEMTIKEAKAKDEAAKEAKEAKLLEDGNLEELAALKTKEADEAKTELAEYKDTEKVIALLDKKEVTEPAIRALFIAGKGDLTELDGRIDGFNEVFNAAVEKAVTKRLGTDPPPKKGKPDEDPKTTSEEIAAIRTDPEKWKEYKKAKGVY